MRSANSWTAACARRRSALVVGTEILDLGMDHPPRSAGERRLDLAVHEEPLSLAQPAAEPRDLVEPDEDEQPARVAQHRLQDGTAAPSRARLVDARHLADGRRLVPRHERGERTERASVLVAERQVVEDVLDRAEAEARELLRALRADAAEHLHLLRERRERGLDRLRDGPVLAPRRRRRLGLAEHADEGV